MIVLDASAVLALLFREPGHDRVAAVLDASALSSVNLAEVLSRFARDGRDVTAALSALLRSPIRVHPFDTDQAARCAALAPATQSLGLSLGDRACLALALTLGAPALTGDRVWAALDLGVDVRLIR